MSVTTLRGGAPPRVSDAVAAEQLCCLPAPPDAEAISRRAIDALGEPLGLPPLAQCITPDDHVAIAVGHGTPAAGAIVSGLVAALAAAGVERTRIRVVAPTSRDALTLEEALQRDTESGVQIESHDPADEDGLCFAGLTRTEKPLRVNRTIFEADVVLPISVERAASEQSAEEAGGVYDGLFPDFFDQQTIERFRRVSTVYGATVGSEGRQAARRAEAEQAGWLVGAPITIRAVPGPGGDISVVLAGTPAEVEQQAREASNTAWETPLAEQADAVLAVITGDAGEQTWSALGRALEAAERLANPGAVIAVWSELSEPIGDALRVVAEAIDPADAAAELGALSGDEALAAWRLAQALERGPVFLHSQLEEDVIDSLGVAPVANAEQMQRMLGRFSSCNVLVDAQYVRFTRHEEAST